MKRPHNYTLKLLRLQAEGKAPASPGLWRCEVRHDDWCGIWRGGRCDCDPVIQFAECQRENEGERGNPMKRQ